MNIFKTHEVFAQLKPYLPSNPIIVEAGAYNGKDSLKLTKHWPQGHVHAFEPVPFLFKQLQEQTDGEKNISCYPVALSNANGFATFFVSENPKKPGKPSQAGSLLEPKERLKHSPLFFPETIEVPTISLDAWAKTHGISHVDLLWLDMQGHELAVLKASQSILPTVKAVFTEVSFIESYANIPQVDEITKWLEENSFKLIGQDYESTTDHFFGNRLFIRDE